MRMRNLPWAPDYLAASSHVIQQPETLRGNWKKHFDKERVLVEIGCGKGSFARQMSEKNPDAAFIAVELNPSVAALAARSFDEQQLENTALIQKNASQISEWFEPGEIDAIYLNFSDPWPKKRNHKRRLSAPSFLKQYRSLLKDNGTLALKSDNASFFSDSVLQLLDAGFVLEKLDVDYHFEEHPEDASTEYERKFIEKGNPIYYSLWSSRRDREV